MTNQTQDVPAQDVPHICIDRLIESEQPSVPVPSRGVAETGKVWKPGSTLRIGFMDGDPVVQQKVKAYAQEWSKYANIHFEFIDNADHATIRISFKEKGSWSYIGTDALKIRLWYRPTMNFGWLTPDSADSEYERVVIHEFGHALGLIHEHQNPATNIPWDKEAVYEYYAGPPNNWSRETTDTNLFKTYSADITNFTEFDRDSIMLYPVQQRFTIGDFEVGWNRQLSAQDIAFIGQLYPFDNVITPVLENQLVIGGEPVAAAISEPTEVDEYTFLIVDEGRYTVETDGRTDLVMRLYGEDDAAVLAEDDDSGRRLNPRITQTLKPSTYTVHVAHFSEKRTGDYTIAVHAE